MAQSSFFGSSPQPPGDPPPQAPSAPTSGSKTPSSFYPGGGAYPAVFDSDGILAQLVTTQAACDADKATCNADVTASAASATAAASSASAASTSATGAAASKSAADTDAANAATSATSASGSASAASTSASNAASSATAASSSATAAAGSATSASGSASSAGTSATNAAGSATAAAGSASAAATSATNAASSATAAASSASSAASAADTEIANRSVRYDAVQSLTSGQKTQARGNIGLATVASTGVYSDLTGRPTLGGSAALNVGTTTGTVAAGDDIRIAGAAQKSANLSDLANVSSARVSLGLGSAAVLTAGTAASNAVQLDGSARLPAVDGSLLTNLPSGALAGYLSGLQISNDASGPTTNIAITIGTCTSDDNSTVMAITSSALKNMTISWSAGVAGGLDTGSIAASTWYHVFAIKNVTSGAVDFLSSLSVSSPTMPSGYTKKRRIGSIRTNASSQIIAFSQKNDEFLWVTAIADAASVNVGTTSGTLITLSVPTGLKVNSLFNFLASCDASGEGRALITSPDQTDQALTSPIDISIGGFVTGIQAQLACSFNTRTNTSAQIRVRSLSASAFYWVTTYGWVDTRGK